ncbi:hypothetical protein FQV39_05280 [Bosea sp. F3-2]|uniref:hypothetical protein n=1 Tax=Bosea sp. F3-2 TaxID=2599640 RepID=UPI0011EC43C5|nr:hypothetical protein [Bosea sp. F3-2]QEL22044.1 hypothetical protein FQV39_05280 [Bosea sp. F3-2]
MSERRIGRPLLAVTGALEAATGLGLLLAPSVVVELLLGAALGTPAGTTLGRVTGIALLALGVACWLARDEASPEAKGLVTALLLYNVGVVAVLVVAWAGLRPVGLAFWPAVLAHAGLTGWCVVCLAMRA